MTSPVLWTLIAIQIAMGAFDTFYHHEMTERLAWRPSQRHELQLHGVRNMLYAALFVVLGWLEVHGLLAVAITVVLAAEVVITLMDFVEEDISAGNFRRASASTHLAGVELWRHPCVVAAGADRMGGTTDRRHAGVSWRLEPSLPRHRPLTASACLGCATLPRPDGLQELKRPDPSPAWLRDCRDGRPFSSPARPGFVGSRLVSCTHRCRSPESSRRWCAIPREQRRCTRRSPWSPASISFQTTPKSMPL